MKHILTLFILFLFFPLANAQHKEFSWLIGSWKLLEQNTYEIWRVDSDSKSLSAISYHIYGSDTTITEEIKITFQEGNFYYTPNVDANRDSVSFKITSYTQNSFIAENPQHDFPKLIRYKLIHRNNAAFIEGSIEGNEKVIQYTFVRQ